MRRHCFSLLLVLILIVPSFAQKAQKRTLPNGLTVLVRENHAAPVVAVRFYVKTGSLYEGKYLGTGISHLFEHVLQEGTKTRTKEQINAETQAIGGQTNAYTSNDVTAYHITTAAPYFERALNNLADSLMNATFPEAEVKTQQGIIHHEMNRGEDNPDRVLWTTFYETAFIRHPVRFPVLGYRAPFDSITRDDILDYYRTHYTPDNTVLAVAGDVEAEEVFTLAEKALGSWERRAATTPVIAAEPLQSTPRRAVVEKNVQNASAMMGWHTIPIQHPDLYALDVLAKVLGGGDSSRLTRELREEKELVYNVSTLSYTPDYDAGIFAITASMSPKNLDEFEKEVMSEVRSIKKAGVSAAELARAKRTIETDYLFASGVENEAEYMAYDFLGTGNPDFSTKYVSRINAVTPSQVQAVANKYLRENGVTTVIVRPTREAAAAPTASAAETKVAPAQMFTLKNGLRVIIRENAASPTVAIEAMGFAGVRSEPAQKAGLANITSEMLLRGTTKRSAQQFSEVVDDMGANLDTGSGYNAWTLSSTWLARDWRRGLSLVHEALTQPAFPEDELRRMKTQVLAAIREQEDEPDAVASQLLQKTFFGDHPYGRTPLGTRETVNGITRADAVAHWKRVLSAPGSVLAIYGDIDASQVRRVVEYLFKDIPASGPAAAFPVAPATLLGKQTVVTDQKADIAQTVLAFAYPGISIKDEDRAALTVLDGALSGIYYPGGRLHARLRDNQLVYGVHAYELRGTDIGTFMISAGTTRDKRDEVRAIIEEEVQKLRNAPISAEELERAKGMAITSHAVGLQSNSEQASSAAFHELLGHGYKSGQEYNDQINAVTREEVQRVAKQYLRPEASAVVIVEPK